MKRVKYCACWKVPTANLLVLLSALCSLNVPKALAGDLNPPPGPIGPTMKPLTDVEPRVAINATNTPGDDDSLFRITEPRSYYLTGNIAGVSGKSGIVITVGGVTLDLMGFEVAGVSGSLDGISARNLSVGNVGIRNGTVRDWGRDGVVGGGLTRQFADLHLLNNARHGLDGGARSLVTRCEAYFNGGDGILLSFESVAQDSVAVGNTGRGIVTQADCVLSGCTASTNGAQGIVTGGGCTVSGCTSNGNQSAAGRGFDVGNGSTVTGCTASGNIGRGIVVGNDSTVTACTATGNSVGIIGGDRVTVTGCTVTFSAFSGIAVGTNSRVTDNISSSNTTAGILTSTNGSRIEGNTVSRNGSGIVLSGAVTGNIVVRNHATFNSGGNYSNPASGNFIGTIITGSAAMNSASNDLVNISFSGL